jgi:pimeloyl-ACP methyl ester carboxylesterase
MGSCRRGVQEEHQAVALPIWQELLVGVELVYLRVSPVYWGFGVPRGDGAAVVVIPGFLMTDFYLTELSAWLSRVGYKAYQSGIGLNAECPNLLMRLQLERTIQTAYKATRRKVHLIGHSLGGLLALSAAAQMPDRVASVITLSAPFRGLVIHPSILRTTELVRSQILEQHGKGVLPACYTSKCTCDFLSAIKRELPKSVRQTAIYTKTDGIVDWRVCRTEDPEVDYEVSATHIGLVFNPLVYSVIAHRLARKRTSRAEAQVGKRSKKRM